MGTVPLRAGVPGADAAVTRLGARTVVRADLRGGPRAGALTPEDGATLAAAATCALERRLPLVVVVASSGADVGAGLSALHGWGTAARAVSGCSGVVPVTMVACGPVASGPALLLGLADLVVMTADAQAFVSGPRMVQAYTGQQVSPAALGGSGVHGRTTGVATFVAADLQEALLLTEDALSFLPDHVDALPTRRPTDDDPSRATPELRTVLPPSPTGAYDVRRVLAAVVDDGEVMELRAGWGGNLVTGLATVDGRPVGVIANQPTTIAGTLDIPGSQKGAAFVTMCDAFNLPLVTLVDTPGFYPGKDLEWRGMIRHGAQLAYAYARATVPRVSVTLRKSYGGAYIVMDSKRIGNDLSLAWPTAEIAVMGAKGAVEVLHRRAAPEARADLETAYEDRFLNPYEAAERGLVDAVIDPIDTRAEVAAALEVLSTKREALVGATHGNTPL